VGRVPRISAQYLSDRDALGLRAARDVSRELGRVVRALATAEVLPEPADPRGIMPGKSDAPVQTFAYARRVPGRNLWLWYQVYEDEVVIVGLTKQLIGM
jgi:hypothetical protein